LLAQVYRLLDSTIDSSQLELAQDSQGLMYYRLGV
jgi:hypothetical protein